MDSNTHLDDSVGFAALDIQTVTAAGHSTSRVIEGVMTQMPAVHTDHRGRVFEIFPGADDYWTKPVVYCYMFSVRVNQVKGWGLHLEKDDRYTLINGEIMTVLYDARLDSPTHGLVQRVYLTENGARQLTIPPGVWHANVNIAQSESHLINHPTEVYHHEHPDRLLLPWDSEQIPADLASLFPIQHFTGTDHHHCS
jgi:dTDP-4-dehydrorhamnose 3,5-epimerase